MSGKTAMNVEPFRVVMLIFWKLVRCNNIERNKYLLVESVLDVINIGLGSGIKGKLLIYEGSVENHQNSLRVAGCVCKNVYALWIHLCGHRCMS